MKLLSRDFTVREKIMLLLLALFLVVLAYYQFVDRPVRERIRKADGEREALRIEVDTVNAQVEELTAMQDELTGLKGIVSMMGSYNNSKEEVDMLDDVLRKSEQYSVTFENVTRDGQQVRRGFNLKYTARNYETAKEILSELANGRWRCLIGDVSCAGAGSGLMAGPVTITTQGTFFETMVGGTPDTGLPSDVTEDTAEVE